MRVDDFLGLDGLALAGLVRRGAISATEAVEAAITRAESVNPAINALVLPRFDEARRTAASPLPAGPFQGVPFLLKDLTVNVAGWPLTNGCRLFADNVGTYTSELAARYIRAGVVLLGRTASPEFGLTVDTTSAQFGVTVNPWDATLSPGGSSGGAAAAVAAGIVPAAQGGDGGGSIRIPAGFCGVFGLKPSRGRNPTGPSEPEGFAGMATAHVLSRSVRDSAALLDATSGPDVGAPYTASALRRSYLDDAATDPPSLRIGLQVAAFTGVEVDAESTAAAEDVAALCAQLGHKVEIANITVDPGTLRVIYETVLCTMVTILLQDRVGQVRRDMRPGDAEVVTTAMMERARTMTATDYARALAAAHTLGRDVARALQPYDVVLTPTSAIARVARGALALSNAGSPQFDSEIRRAVAFTQIYNVAGLPAMSIPVFWLPSGMPVGVQFGARYGEESTLFQLAGQLERARPWFHQYARCCRASDGRRSAQ